MCTAVSSTVNADEFDWQVVKTKGDVTVSQSSVEDSPFKISRGVMLSEAGMFDVLSVLRDVSACSKWLHKCKSGRIIEELGVSGAIYHTVIDSPLMLKDRETYVRSTIAYFPDLKELRIDMEGVEDIAPLDKKRVRVLDFKGYWLIEQHESEHIQLTYEVHMDPQVGAVRAANSTLATSVLETMINVDRLAREEPYRDSSVSAERLDQITQPAQPHGGKQN
ncbi:MAG: hypothetical protein AB8G18_17650 [Gammaproteobacteria bacterium]